MHAGDVFRARNVRTYEDDPRNWYEAKPDHEKARDLKRAFVCLLLGTEAFEIVDKTGKRVMASLDPTRALNRLGWWSEEQIRKASGPKAGDKLMNRLNGE